MANDAPLRIAYLTYRGKPHVGGQGVYTRHLAKALVDLGHHVEVLGGQPYPILDERVPLIELPSLDIYNDHFPMRQPGIWELKNWKDVLEVTAFIGGTFPEPFAFSMRAWDHLRHRQGEFDIVQDNQCLGWGLLLIERQLGIPVLGTIHHPITVDRRLEIEAAESWYKKLTLRRWYSFVDMQTEVARRLKRIITVSENSFKDIVHDHKVDPDRMAVVPVGVDVELFKPVDSVRTYGQIVAHVAGANYEFCSAAKGEKAPNSEAAFDKLTAKADIVKAWDGSVAYCDAVYKALTDRTAGAEIDMPFNMGKAPRARPLIMNAGHLNEHYGNLVTYMRIKGIVPPTSR